MLPCRSSQRDADQHGVVVGIQKACIHHVHRGGVDVVRHDEAVERDDKALRAVGDIGVAGRGAQSALVIRHAGEALGDHIGGELRAPRQRLQVLGSGVVELELAVAREIMDAIAKAST